MRFGKGIYVCNHHPKQDIEHFYHSREFRYTLLQSTSPSSIALGNHCFWLFVYYGLALPFLEFYINAIIQYASFTSVFFYLHIAFEIFRVVTCCGILFLFTAE